jgi:cell wall-associated NlpC family hydrolase
MLSGRSTCRGALAVASAMCLSACAARSVPPSPPRGVAPPRTAPEAGAPLVPGTASPWSPVGTPAGAQPVVATALALVGTPYRDGGSAPDGFDCSGFVQYVFGRHGWHVPRTVAAQFLAGRPVATGDVRAGDLLFFATMGEGPTHVAIALEGGRFVHAPSGRGRVRVDSFVGRYWPPRYVGARRLVSSG